MLITNTRILVFWILPMHAISVAWIPHIWQFVSVSAMLVYAVKKNIAQVFIPFHQQTIQTIGWQSPDSQLSICQNITTKNQTIWQFFSNSRFLLRISDMGNFYSYRHSTGIIYPYRYGTTISYCDTCRIWNTIRRNISPMARDDAIPPFYNHRTLCCAQSHGNAL